MFVHVSPEPDAIGETISTLKFAERVATVELGAARVNRDSADVKDLKEQVTSIFSLNVKLPPQHGCADRGVFSDCQPDGCVSTDRRGYRDEAAKAI